MARHSEELKNAILKQIEAGADPIQLAHQHGIRPVTVELWAASQKVIEKLTFQSSVRILILDIETLPNLTYSFDLYSDRPIPLAFLVKAKAICTIAYKFIGDPEATVLAATNPYDDKLILRQLLPVIEQAHYVVAHYGDGFDIPFISARLMANRLPALPPVATVDTYKLAKKHFGRSLNSNKLDHLAAILGVGNKNKTEATLWVRCADGDHDALKEMAAYNKQDVDLLEKVFVGLLPYLRSKINLNLLTDDAVFRCRPCGSSNLEHKGFELTAASLRHRYCCRDCGSWSTTKPKKP